MASKIRPAECSEKPKSRCIGTEQVGRDLGANGPPPSSSRWSPGFTTTVEMLPARAAVEGQTCLAKQTPPRPQWFTLASRADSYPRVNPIGLLANVSEAKSVLRPLKPESLYVARNRNNPPSKSAGFSGLKPWRPVVAVSDESASHWHKAKWRRAVPRAKTTTTIQANTKSHFKHDNNSANCTFMPRPYRIR